MQWKFEYIKASINPATIKEIAGLDDEAIKITMAGLFCRVAGGLKYVPQKAYNKKVAKAMIKKGFKMDDVIDISGISRSAYYKFKKETDERSIS